MLTEDKKFTYNVCRVVGHEMVNKRFCDRCGLHKFVDDLGKEVTALFIGHPRSKELPDYVHAYARKLLDKLVSEGTLARYTGLSIAKDVTDDSLYLEFVAQQYPYMDLTTYAIRLPI